MANLSSPAGFPVDKTSYLALIVDSSDDAIIGTDLDYVIKSWNKAATKIFGYTEAEAVGQPVRLILPASRAHEEEMIIAKVKAGERVEHYETKRVAKSGEEIEVSLTVSPIRNIHGEIIGASKILRNVTEHIRKNEELKSYATELRRLNYYKDNLLKLASHELNTPLTTLKVYLELCEDLDRESNIGCIHRALAQCRKLEKLIQQLLDYSKFEDGSIHLIKDNVNLSALLHSVVMKFKNIAEEREIICEGLDEEIILQADKAKLEEVLTNLLSNAIKFSGRSTPVKVSLVTNATWAVVQIQDFGIGIKKDHLPHIFDRFYKVAYIESTFPGLGLNLHKSKEIINCHGGDILVDSTPGKGSTFKILLPLQ